MSAPARDHDQLDLSDERLPVRLGSPARYSLRVKNIGMNITSLGNERVNYANGTKLFPGAFRLYEGPDARAGLFAVCESGLTTTVEWEETTIE